MMASYDIIPIVLLLPNSVCRPEIAYHFVSRYGYRTTVPSIGAHMLFSPDIVSKFHGAMGFAIEGFNCSTLFFPSFKDLFHNLMFISNQQNATRLHQKFILHLMGSIREKYEWVDVWY